MLGRRITPPFAGDSSIFNELNVGDTVKVTYTEAVIVDVLTAGRSE